jgi:outer membrane protein assembly factor BamB
MTKTGGSLLAGMLMTATAFSADWPQFCGPQRNNRSAETGLARSWPSDGPAVLWTATVTAGFAGPAVKDGTVYLLDHDGARSSIRALELTSGKERWTCSFADPGELANKKYPGTRGTPTVTDDSLYAVTLFGTVVGVDLKTQKVKWQRSLVKDYAKKIGGFGMAQSPLLVGDLVIVAPLTETASLVALDKNTGKEVWKVSGYPGSGFVSPLIVSIDGQDQILMVAGGAKPPKPGRPNANKKTDEDVADEVKSVRPTYVFAVSPQDGHVLWSYDGWSCDNPIPHPVAVDRNTLFITSGYKSISAMIKVEKKEGGFSVKEVFKTENAATQIEQPVFVNNHLFVGGTVKTSRRGLICLDLEGNVKWDSGTASGAPVFNDLNMIAVDGMLIGLDGDSGMLYLIEASPTAFKQLAAAKVLAEKGQTWAPIALSDGKLLVRDHTVMKCLNLK